MNDLPAEQPEEDHQASRSLTQLEQTNRDLLQQIDDCRKELGRVQAALGEAQTVVAQRRQLEAEQGRLLVQERELNELKSNFINLASHEFRTPMMTILSSASLIGRYSGSEEGDNRERHVQRIKAAVGNLTTMLDGFLAISRVDQYDLQSTPQMLELTALCREVITAVQATAKPGQHFHYQPQTGTVRLRLDKPLLKNSLFNLLTNASKYSADGTDIHLTSTILNGQVVFTVTDQGIGIPDSDKDKLFTHFFRARNAIHIQGVGLGLYLAKRYVDLLGGSISFTSEVGKGTAFTVQLPLLSERA
ncbi:sensor histidine kinase [Spirosoma fluminis]